MNDAPEIVILQHPEWLALDWLVHGFSTRPGGNSLAYTNGCGELNLGFTADDSQAAVLLNRELLLRRLLGNAWTDPQKEADDGFEPLEEPQLTTIRQVHSADIQVVDELARSASGAASLTGDGLVTDVAGVNLGILTADCVPVLLADVRHRAVGAFHAGWRGTIQRIVEGGVYRMRVEFGSDPQDMMALIGPAIGACCYAVGPELRGSFGSAFSYAAELFSAGAGGAIHLDLREANRRQLLAGGLAPDKIHILGACTSCHPESFFSHRASNGRAGRMMSVVGLRS